METNKKPVGRPKKRSMAGTAAISNPGRPRKTNMNDVSYSTLNRRAHELAEQFDVSTIELALNIAKKNANCIDVCENNDDSAIIKHSLESAFALFLENDVSKALWIRLVHDSAEKNAPIYPSYYNLSKVKAQCQPMEFRMESEMCVEVSFQAMLNLTAERIVTAVGTDWSINDLNDLVLICAYGFDSSSGFKNPQQRFNETENISLKSELSLFASTFTLVGLTTSTKRKMWINPTPQSIRFCRPLRIAIEKETGVTIIAEKTRLDIEVEELHSHQFLLPNNKSVTVDFKAYFTMIDGKVLNHVLDNSATTRCPVCYLSMDNFNKNCDWTMIVPSSNLQHGISNLHCEIKTLEQLIKLSCRNQLPLPTWTVRKEMKGKKKIVLLLYDFFDFESRGLFLLKLKHAKSLTGNNQ